MNPVAPEEHHSATSGSQADADNRTAAIIKAYQRPGYRYLVLGTLLFERQNDRAGLRPRSGLGHS